MDHKTAGYVFEIRANPLNDPEDDPLELFEDPMGALAAAVAILWGWASELRQTTGISHSVALKNTDIKGRNWGNYGQSYRIADPAGFATLEGRVIIREVRTRG